MVVCLPVQCWVGEDDHQHSSFRFSHLQLCKQSLIQLVSPIVSDENREGALALISTYFAQKSSPKGALPRLSGDLPAASPLAESRVPPSLEARLESDLIPAALGELGALMMRPVGLCLADCPGLLARSVPCALR